MSCCNLHKCSRCWRNNLARDTFTQDGMCSIMLQASPYHKFPKVVDMESSTSLSLRRPSTSDKATHLILHCYRRRGQATCRAAAPRGRAAEQGRHRRVRGPAAGRAQRHGRVHPAYPRRHQGLQLSMRLTRGSTQDSCGLTVHYKADGKHVLL